MNWMSLEAVTVSKEQDCIWIKRPNENPRKFRRVLSTISSERSEPLIGHGSALTVLVAFSTIYSQHVASYESKFLKA